MKYLIFSVRTAVFGLLLACSLLVGTPVRAMELVVLQANGIDMQPGQVVDGSAPLSLQAGQRLSLIAPNGQMIELQGPYNQAPDPKDGMQQGVVASLKALVVAKNFDDSGLGVSRSATDVIQSAEKDGWVPDPWLINVAQTGDQCHQANQPLVFWRPEKVQSATLTVLVGKNVWEAETQWPRGADKLASPLRMPLLDNETYLVRMNGGTEVKVTLHIIPTTVSTNGMRAAWMHAKGCHAQTLALLRTL